LTGARGVGKTMLLLQHISELYNTGSTKCLYVSLDNLAIPFKSLAELASWFSMQGGELLVIDEIHKYPSWAEELKNIYDSQPNLKVIFSGSSALNLYTGVSDLSRRAVFYNLDGLSFREFVEIETCTSFPKYSLADLLANHKDICNDLLKKFKPFEYFNKYLQHGYYPFYLQGLPTYGMKLQNVINYVIENEIPVLSNANHINVMKLKRFISLLANSVPYVPNIQKLSEVLELNRNTLVNYLAYLSQTRITCNLYDKSAFYGSLSKPQKILLHHPNIYYCIVSLPENSGSIRESFFVNQLSAQHRVSLAEKGDFWVDEQYLFDIGGKNKKRNQIAGEARGYVIKDDIEEGWENIIPLWLFGFLY